MNPPLEHTQNCVRHGLETSRSGSCLSSFIRVSGRLKEGCSRFTTFSRKWALAVKALPRHAMCFKQKMPDWASEGWLHKHCRDTLIQHRDKVVLQIGGYLKYQCRSRLPIYGNALKAHRSRDTSLD